MPRPRRPRPVSKAERWLNLLAFLLDRRAPVSRTEIMRNVEDYRTGWLAGTDTARESARRKFERDKEELRALGINLSPVATVEHEGTDQLVDAYQFRAGDFYLPYLEVATGRPSAGAGPYRLPQVTLTAAELEILRRAAERVLALGDTPLGASATSALRKLCFDLPGLAPGDAERVVGGEAGRGDLEAFGTLREGLEARRAVQCRYYAIGRDAEEERVIEPYGLMLTWGNWYCVARARDRQAIRVFRLSRMKQARVLSGEGSRFAVPAGFDLAGYAGRTPWELSDAPPVTARVVLGFPHSRWTIAEGLGRVVEPLRPDGGALLEFDVRAPEAFIRWLLTFGPQAELLGPPEFVARLADEQRRLRALYA